MSFRRVTAPLISLFLFSAFAVAQVSAPNCTSTEWNWTFNSLNQSPCTVVAYIAASCSGGSYIISPLSPGNYYPGPTSITEDNLCNCNTVVYSLFSACDACQGEKWIAWSVYTTNCTETLHPSFFPNPVPSQIRVPLWALLDVTKGDSWNPNISYAVGDAPEQGPGSTLGPLSASPAPTSLSTPRPSGSNSNTAAIVGGVIGGIAAASIVVTAIFFYLRRRRSQVLSKSAEFAGIDASQPHIDELSRPSAVTVKLYDPDDPTTFPGYQDVMHSLDVPDVPTSSPIEHGSTLLNKQTS